VKIDDAEIEHGVNYQFIAIGGRVAERQPLAVRSGPAFIGVVIEEVQEQPPGVAVRA
jgi:hypothetical protein